MREVRTARFTYTAVLALLLCGLNSPALAQKESRRGKFGDSLKRLRWDARKQAAVERPDGKSASTPTAGESDPPAGDDTIKLETVFVGLDVTVTDPATSRFVTGLGKDDFSVTEDGVPQPVAVVSPGDHTGLPRSVILVLDTSGSQAAYLKSSMQAAKSLVSQLTGSDEMAIVSDDVELLTDFTGDKSRLFTTLDQLDSRVRKKGESGKRGRSLQFTALFAALRELTQGEGRRYMVIFQSDGDEAVTFRDQPYAQDYLWNMPRREYGLADIFNAAEKSRATVYTIIPGERLTGLAGDVLRSKTRALLLEGIRARFNTEEQYRQYIGRNPLSDLQVKMFAERFARAQASASRLAELTGGWTAYLERPEQATELYSQILADITHRYTVGYYPGNTVRDGRLRQVRVEVRNRPQLKVHGRTSYRAPGD